MTRSALKPAAGSASAFEEMRLALNAEIVSAIEAFGAKRGLPPLDHASLRQMSVKLPDAAQEILMFGFDLWPDDLPGDDTRDVDFLEDGSTPTPPADFIEEDEPESKAG